MRFEPKLPREGINVSKQHPLKEATLLVVGLGAVFLLIFLALVWFVDITVRLIPRHAEAKVFSSWQLTDLGASDRGERVEAVQALLDRLLEHAPESPYTFRIGVLPTDDLNALALPGGLILVTDGLLDQVETENELALVLGHELGHYQQRDHLRQLGRGVVLGIAISAVTQSRSSISLSELVARQTLNGFGRRAESEADRFGLELVVAEYGHTAHAQDFFERLREGSDGADRLVAYLSTHPASAERILDLDRYAIERGWPRTGDSVPISFSNP